MLKYQNRDQGELFVVGSLKDLIPADHILKQIDQVLDLSWLRGEVAELYCLDNGRPGVDPEAAVRLMLAGLSQGITKDRKLMREAQVNLAIRWFAGFRLDEKLPSHSSLTRIRQRWGLERFARIFARSVAQCVEVGLVDGKTVHVDATLIRADVSWESLVREHVAEVWQSNPEEDPGASDGTDSPTPPKRGGRSRKARTKVRTVSRTDPEASMSTSCKQYRMEPCYKQHTAVDDKAGVVVDVELTTGQASEGRRLMDQIDRVEEATGERLETVTADSGYAHGKNYQALEDRDIVEVIPPQRRGSRSTTKGHIPVDRFKFDRKHNVVRCPRGRALRPGKKNDHGTPYRSRRTDCRDCPLASRCLGIHQATRVVMRGEGSVALLRARRRHRRGSPQRTRLYNRHRGLVEGRHGEAKSCHGLARAARRGRINVAIQVYLTAAIMNLKRLAALHAPLGLDWLPVLALLRLSGPQHRLHPDPMPCQRLAA
jgi:transposase